MQRDIIPIFQHLQKICVACGIAGKNDDDSTRAHGKNVTQRTRNLAKVHHLVFQMLLFAGAVEIQFIQKIKVVKTTP